MTCLHLDDAHRAMIEAACLAALPDEACGLLIGTAAADRIHVDAVVPAANIAQERRAGFELDPAVHFHWLRATRGTGRAVLGHFHSHPGGAPEPSARDCAQACETGAVWLIQAMRDGRPAGLGAFVAQDGTLAAIPLCGDDA